METYIGNKRALVNLILIKDKKCYETYSISILNSWEWTRDDLNDSSLKLLNGLNCLLTWILSDSSGG